jgi:hypothetical protein
VAEDKPDRVIFINSSALEASDVHFLLNFLNEMYRQMTDAESLETKGLQKAILDGELEQQFRLGLPFALVAPPTKQIMKAAHQEMIIAWAEMSTLRSIAPKEDRSAVAKFISDRIAMFEEALKGKFEDVVLTGILPEFFVLYLRAGALLMALADDPYVFSAARRRYEEAHQLIVQESIAKGVPSLGRALTVISRGLLEPSVYENANTFANRIPELVVAATKELAPEFYDTLLPLFLLHAGHAISEKLSLEPEGIPEPAINEFLELCDSLGKKAGSNLLLDFVARQMKLQVLLTLGYYVHDPIICKRVERIASENLTRFEGRLRSYHIPFWESQLDDGDLYIDLLAAASFCMALGDFEAYSRLRGLLVAHQDRHDAKTALAQLLWGDFIAREDYDALTHLRALIPEVRADRIPLNKLLEPMFEMFATMADAILIESGRYERFARAQLFAATQELSAGAFVKDLIQYLALNSFFATLPFLYRAAEADSVTLLASNLRHAVEASSHFAIAERPDSPNQLIFLKTLMVEKMALEDVAEVSRLAEIISKHPFASPNTKLLVSLAGKWVDAKAGKVDPVFSVLGSSLKTQSPWILAASRVMLSTAASHYLKVVGSRPESGLEKSMEGRANFWKGMALELGLQVCYVSEGYDVQSRVILDGEEMMDLVCSRRQDSSCEVLFVDAKFESKTYGLQEAAYLARRVRKLKDSLAELIPRHEMSRFLVSVVVASLGGISKGAREVLRDELKSIPVSVISGDSLAEFLKVHKVKLPLRPPS